MDSAWQAREASSDFRDARRKAFIGAIIDTVRRQSNDMFSLEEVRARLNVRGQRYLGHQVVPIENIIGSEGRYFDFDRRFLPRSETLKQRWSSIGAARLQSVELPPVDLYKIGDVYFVRDGNHRVSVGRQQGQAFMDAYVTELVVDVPLGPDISVFDLVLKEEYSDFLEWTELNRLRPQQRIEFSELGGYLDLVKHINAHRYYMGIEQNRPIERDEAIADWYDKVYMPIIEVIRGQNVLSHFPNRTEADLYRWIMEHRWYMRERVGVDPSVESAVNEYVDLFGNNGLAVISEALRGAWQRIGNTFSSALSNV